MAVQSVTVHDVAREAGVSVGTVSRYINGYSNMLPRNASRVQCAIDKLGYRRCESARLLGRRRSGGRHSTGNVGLYLPFMSAAWSNHPLVAAYMRGVERVCSERGFHPLVEFAHEDDDMTCPRFVTEEKVDGLLIKTLYASAVLLRQAAERIPVVGVSMYEPSLDIPQVAPDNYRAGYQVATHLWEHGHRRIAFLSSSDRHPMFRLRCQGAEAFIRDQREPSSFTHTEAHDEGRRTSRPNDSVPDVSLLLDRLWAVETACRPTAIVAANDWTAAGLYDVLHRRGIRPGTDVSIVGFDNMTTLADVLRPRLTSYAIPLEEVAATATCILLDWIESGAAGAPRGSHLVSGRLVQRESVSDIRPANHEVTDPRTAPARPAYQCPQVPNHK
ncbi:MAG: LacI family DNA-binding transcriptional regulator [Phycisphaerae bacterium]|nr:LacI family DNA-binding transcriptional regulator [Phycisphaerae bacterium]